MSKKLGFVPAFYWHKDAAQRVASIVYGRKNMQGVEQEMRQSMGQREARDYRQEILDSLRVAEMVLVGLGEEFDNLRNIRNAKGYAEGRDLLLDSEQSSLIPVWQQMFRETMPGETEKMRMGLQKLSACLEGKNYFVVSTATNSEIARIPWREGRLVMPCGSDLHCQCSAACEEHLRILQNREREHMRIKLQRWKESAFQGGAPALTEISGNCSVCGYRIMLNNIYNEKYDENGYLADWQNYTKWLQGTLNKNIVVLELGVGMSFPSVIRFPFEKIAFYNHKAKFYRVHESLYQLTEDLAEKGLGIAKNAIDWLQNLC